MRIAITGSRGQLGSELVPLLWERGEVLAWDRPSFDLTDPDVGAAVFRQRPAVVVHTAAYTDVDGCERDPAHAMAVNAEGTRRLASSCAATGAFLVYLSTDYVFNGRGTQPYRESDPTDPLSVYGRSKLAGEDAVRQQVPHHCIVRTSWLFGPCGKNFPKAILAKAKAGETLRVVDDQVGCPTYAPDLARAIATLIEREARGTYHVRNSGCASWFEFARAILDYTGMESAVVAPISTEQLDRPAPRPAYSVLHNGRYRELVGGSLPPWQEAVQDFLRRVRQEADGGRPIPEEGPIGAVATKDL